MKNLSLLRRGRKVTASNRSMRTKTTAMERKTMMKRENTSGAMRAPTGTGTIARTKRPMRGET
jgi:hypothetical protein